MALTLVNAMQCTVLPHITPSVFINDDERGLHQDDEKWLEGLAPHAPVSQCRPRGRLQNRTDQACLEQASVPRESREQCRRAPEAERNSQCCA
jgi:hypothetical protein